MIAYNTSWLDNLWIHGEVDRALGDGLVDPGEVQAIKERYPVGFFSPNLFLRIAFFLLTLVIIAFSMGLLTLFFLGNGTDKGLSGLGLFYGLACYGALEFLVGGLRHYKSGADDALLWVSFGLVAGNVEYLSGASPTGFALLVFILSLYLSLRFKNQMMSAVAVLSFLAVLFLLYIKLGSFAKATVPFLLMAVNGGLYWLFSKADQRIQWRRYTDCFLISTVAVLVCFYLAGNYLVVREAGRLLFESSLAEDEGITLGWFFWAWTAVVPVAYMLRGLQKKDVVLLRTGLLLSAILILTVRTYYHLAPLEFVLVAGGFVLLATAYALLRLLATTRGGFTSLQSRDPHALDKLNVETLVIAETFRAPQQSVPSGDVPHGEGESGGGGASSSF